MIDNGRSGYGGIDRLQIYGLLSLYRGCIELAESKGLAGTVDSSAVIAADRPAYKFITFRCSGRACHNNVCIVRVAVPVQFHIQRFHFFTVVQHAVAGNILQIVGTHLGPVEPECNIVIDDPVKVIGHFSTVSQHLVPAVIAVVAGFIGKSGEFRGFGWILCIVGISVRPAVSSALPVSCVIDIVPGSGIRRHIIPGDSSILLDSASVGRPEPGRPGSCQCTPVIGIQGTVIGINGHNVPAQFPAGIDRQVRTRHGFKEHLAGSGERIIGHLREERTHRTGLVRKPACEGVPLPARCRIGRDIGSKRRAIPSLIINCRQYAAGFPCRFHRIGKGKCKGPAGHIRFGIPVVAHTQNGTAIRFDGHICI